MDFDGLIMTYHSFQPTGAARTSFYTDDAIGYILSRAWHASTSHSHTITVCFDGLRRRYTHAYIHPSMHIMCGFERGVWMMDDRIVHHYTDGFVYRFLAYDYQKRKHRIGSIYSETSNHYPPIVHDNLLMHHCQFSRNHRGFEPGWINCAKETGAGAINYIGSRPRRVTTDLLGQSRGPVLASQQVALTFAKLEG